MRKATATLIVLSLLSAVAYEHVKALKAENASKEAVIKRLAIQALEASENVTTSEIEAAEAMRRATPISERLQLPKVAIVTAYTCDPSMTKEQKSVNCPNGTTASGTVPVPYETAACDPANLGKTFRIEGIGETVCEDTGSSVKGPGRFDIFLANYEDAREFGVRRLPYAEVK